MKLFHLGAEHAVTGSCHLLQAAGRNILIDCGMAQGGDRVVSMDQWPVKPEDIHYLFLTHAHLDHIGRAPELLKRGFRGEILCTHGTKALLGPMLEDALDFTDFTGPEKEHLLADLDRLSWGFEYNEIFDLVNGVAFTLGRAGHILGSCWISLRLPDGQTIVFSGDLGAEHTPILPDPDAPEGCDLLVMESTYGDRLHEDRTERVDRLGRMVKRALTDGGKVFIPAFALGRTQELIYEMDRLFSDPQSDLEPLPVFIDSPLGLEITAVYARLSEYWDKEAADLHQKGDHPMDFDHLYAVQDHSEHLKLMEMNAPAVIVAGSGMCSGGRIVNHLKWGLGDPKNDVFFVGYQAHGTPGRDIITYADRPDGYVVLDGERHLIRAQVHSLSGYSAHADQAGLIKWVEAMGEKPGRIKLVHGDPRARRILADRLNALGHSTDGA